MHPEEEASLDDEFCSISLTRREEKKRYKLILLSGSVPVLLQ